MIKVCVPVYRNTPVVQPSVDLNSWSVLNLPKFARAINSNVPILAPELVVSVPGVKLSITTLSVVVPLV